MKNILGTTENLTFYNKEGVKVYDFNTNFNGSSYERTYEFTYDKYGNALTHRNSRGYYYKYTRDENGYVLTFKDSKGYSYEFTYDESGNELTYKDSYGKKRGFNIPEFTMEELTQKLGNFKLKK